MRKLILILSLILSFSLPSECPIEPKPIPKSKAKVTRVVKVVRAKRYVTEREYNLLLRVCMSETGGANGEPIEGKIAVVETILNRVDLGYGTIEQVIYSPNQYSTANNGQPDEVVRQAVDTALAKKTYPPNMLYFRTSYFHKFGKPYKKIGNHYFNLME